MSSHPLYIADGATGTSLLPLGSPVEQLNLSNPEAVKALHSAYIDSGATIIRTNTFNLPSPAEEGARIALEAAGSHAEVWGVGGPVMPSAGLDLNMLYLNHFRSLTACGVTRLHIETSINSEALTAATRAALQVVEPEAISLSVFLHPRALTPLDITTFIAIARTHGITHVGLNCMPPDTFMHTLLKSLLLEFPKVSAFPEGGGLKAEEWREACNQYCSSLPLYSLGGCCGTTPHHIKLLARR